MVLFIAMYERGTLTQSRNIWLLLNWNDRTLTGNQSKLHKIWF